MKTLLALILTLSSVSAMAVSNLVLKNQFGEQSINVVQGSVVPLSGSGNVLLMNGATAPVNGTTGDNIAGKGSIYVAQDTGAIYSQIGLITNPVWQNSLVPSVETVSAAGAISTVVTETTLANASGANYAVTLAAPSGQDGQIKILKLSTATHAVTMALTNVAMSGAYTPTGTTTLTFSITGQTAIFMAVGGKWVYLGGSAVAS